MSDINISDVTYGVRNWSNSYKDGPFSDWVGPYVGADSQPAMRFRLMRTGGKTPGFRSKGKKSVLPFNFFSYERSLIRNNGGNIRFKTPYTDENFSGMVDSGTPSATGPTGAEVYALEWNTKSRFFERLKGQKINLAQVFAERNQTAKLIGDSAIKIADIIMRLRKGDVAGALGEVGPDFNNYKNNRRNRGKKKKAVQKHASQGLAVQYGIKPLMGDCFGAAQALGDATLNLPKPTRLKSKGSQNFSTGTSTQSGYSIEKRATDSYYEYKVMCTLVVDGAINSFSALGLTNPAALAWELLPWSFVADWFFDIGSLVSSWDATLGVQFVSGGEVRYENSRLTREVSFIDGGPYSGGYSGLSTRVLISRTPLSGFPTLGLPPYKDQSSLEHMFNGILLLAGACSKPVKPKFI